MYRALSLPNTVMNSSHSIALMKSVTGRTIDIKNTTQIRLDGIIRTPRLSNGFSWNLRNSPASILNLVLLLLLQVFPSRSLISPNFSPRKVHTNIKAVQYKDFVLPVTKFGCLRVFPSVNNADHMFDKIQFIRFTLRSSRRNKCTWINFCQDIEMDIENLVHKAR